MSFSESHCRHYALRLLARREHSRLELQQKLSAKGFNAPELEALLSQLEAENLLSDARFAEAYIRSRRQRGFGPQRIRLELQRRGVADETVAAYLHTNSADWVALARAQYKKRFGERQAPNYEERARRARFLLGRGFSKEVIYKVLDEMG
jgi:regulatory protein